MIVIATHNGINLLKNLLSDIKSFNISNENICVVDNQSKNTEHLSYIENLKSEGYKVLYNPTDTYEIGAFKHAFNNLISDVWFCLQDSLRIKRNIFEEVEPKLTNKNVYTLLTFTHGIYDSADDIDFIQKHYKTTMYSRGIFGSNMFLKNEVAQLVKNDWVLPTNKFESMATERGLSIVFDNYDIEIIGIDEFRYPEMEDPNHYDFFSKVFTRRA